MEQLHEMGVELGGVVIGCHHPTSHKGWGTELHGVGIQVTRQQLADKTSPLVRYSTCERAHSQSMILLDWPSLPLVIRAFRAEVILPTSLRPLQPFKTIRNYRVIYYKGGICWWLLWIFD